METYFTVEELAKYLQFAEKTIYKWVINQEIPFIKINQTIRFKLSDIEKWLEDKKVISPSDKKAAVAGELFNKTEITSPKNDCELPEAKND